MVAQQRINRPELDNVEQMYLKSLDCFAWLAMTDALRPSKAKLEFFKVNKTKFCRHCEPSEAIQKIDMQNIPVLSFIAFY
jgi:hypothetical protein